MSKREKFQKSILNSGATLVTESLPQFQSLSIGVWVKAGSRHELPHEEGISHFLEHMMFKGTKSRSALQIAKEIDSVGGEFNAFTSREYTCFHLLLLSKDVGLAVDILSDVILNSKFDSTEVERERKVVLQEIAMTEDSPEELAHDLFFEKAFKDQTLGKPILGTRKSVASFTRKKVVDYFHQHYTPSRIVIAVAGNVSHEEVKRKLNRAFQTKALRNKQKVFRELTQSRAFFTPIKHIEKRRMEQCHIVLGYPSVTQNSPQRFVAYLLSSYLGGGMSSSLFQEIREKRGLAYSVYSTVQPFSDCGVFLVYLATSSKDVGKSLRILDKEINRLIQKKITKEELYTLKENLKGTVLLNSDSTESRMTSIAKGEMFFKSYLTSRQICQLIDQTDVSGLQKMALKTFDPKRRSLVLYGDIKKNSL
ncbi:MAG: M16 family metallopeptidase [Bacteriovoracia bacterium]